MDLLLGAAYFLGLFALAILTALIRPGWRYVAAVLGYLVGLMVLTSWTVSQEDGPVGFAVLAMHSLMFWVALIANAVKWTRILWRRLRASNNPGLS